MTAVHASPPSSSSDTVQVGLLQHPGNITANRKLLTTIPQLLHLKSMLILDILNSSSLVSTCQLVLKMT